MSLLITLVLLGAVNLAICNPDDPYTPECIYPIGFLPANDSITSPDYEVLKPIERCCPACDGCVHVGGHCKLNYITEMYPQFCDFKSIPECRDYICTCCVKCALDKCSPCVETGGECRVECRSGELEDINNKCSFHANYDRPEGCKCCKRCEATSECIDAFGKCVTSPLDCPVGSYASTGCCGGCYCCKPVFHGVPSTTPGVPDGCSEPGSYCSPTDECANGYYSCYGQCQQTLYQAGLQIIELGYCCVPKQVGSVSRRSEALPNPVKQFMGFMGPSQDQF